MQNRTHEILEFLHVAETLKNELRHSWTSRGRQESVAEHSWRLSLMIILCAPHFDQKIDLLKALQLAILHDIGEAKIGDMHYFDATSTDYVKKERKKAESAAVRDLSSILGDDGNHLYSLWKDFEDKSSPEAQIVYFLDKLEACVQHLEADSSTWTARELSTIGDHFEELTINDKFLMSLKETIKLKTFKKLNLNTKTI